MEAGDRLMDVTAQGQDVFTDFDILSEAGKLGLIHPPHERCSTGVLTATHISMQWQSSCGQDVSVGRLRGRNGNGRASSRHMYDMLLSEYTANLY